jgi:hypothetical protein
MNGKDFMPPKILNVVGLNEKADEVVVNNISSKKAFFFNPGINDADPL